jgi:archaeal type IV pilus assembly protein PilA
MSFNKQVKKKVLMESRTRRSKKAISPVLATVILIAITLIAAVAIGGFVFGLFGTFTSTAQVSAGTVTCSGTPEVCTLPLQNIGSANTAITGVCNMNLAGGNYVGTAAMVSGSLKAGSSAKVTCTGPASEHAAAGSQITGYVILGNGAEVLFVATAA